VIVVSGVIDAIVVQSAKPKVQGRDSGMLKKWRVIGTRAECADAKIRTRPRFSALFRRAIRDSARLQSLPDSQLRLGIVDIFRDGVDELFQSMRSACVQESAAVAVGIDVDRRFLSQFFLMLFHPFR